MHDILARLPTFLANHPMLALAFVGVLLALIVTEVQRLTRGFTGLTPAGLTQLINRENALVIDVSGQQEFEKAHIPGSRHIALGQFDPAHPQVAKSRDVPVALVCRRGVTAAQAARKLRKAGFQRVYLLEGGIAAWQQAQLPLASGRA